MRLRRMFVCVYMKEREKDKNGESAIIQADLFIWNSEVFFQSLEYIWKWWPLNVE